MQEQFLFLLSVYPEGKMGRQKSLLEGPRPVISCEEWGCARKEVTLPCAVSLQSISFHPYLLLMLSAHLRQAGTLDYLSWMECILPI